MNTPWTKTTDSCVAETLGSLVDQLFTTDHKLWESQDELYAYDRMTPEEFASVPASQVHRTIKRVAQLNLLRNELMTSIDSCLAEAVRTGTARVDARVKITG